MRPAKQRARVWMLIPAVVVLAWLAPACGSNDPSYCGAGDQLKTSLNDLGNVDVVKNGLDSLTSALNKVKTDAAAFVNEAKSTFQPQTEALEKSLSGLNSALTSAQDQSLPNAAKSITSSLSQVGSAASDLQNAVSDKC